ncbi:MAG: hypothetical protein QXI58_04000, partial [Candidatus Micrarchaeia archaeon]
MDIRKRLKEIEEILPGDYGNLSSAKKYLDSIERSGVNELLSVFEKMKDVEFDYYSSFYEIFSKELNFITYSLKDIEDLCPIIKGDEDKIGVYISAVINKIIKDEDEVRLNFGDRRINFIGMYLSKGKIIVEGNAGDFVGSWMKGGSIHIKGNGRNYVGYEMGNGNIIVEGNAGGFVGCRMKGGIIHIKGNAGSFVGCYSKGGEIRIDGEYKSIGDGCKANIYHKGKLVRGWLKFIR